MKRMSSSLLRVSSSSGSFLLEMFAGCLKRNGAAPCSPGMLT